jgi:MoaA/NifB/PqqE/SkfB family radical SAM enzyme/SAM-dependent methyltransferase
MTGQTFYQQLARYPRFSQVHPQLGAFLQDYLAGEKVVPFGDQYVINTHFPAFPSRPFERMLDQYEAIGLANRQRQLYSVTVAVTNRCQYRCWHCYNAGRSQQDMSLDQHRAIARSLCAMGAIKVTLTGGEPLLRDDLVDIVAAYDEEASLCLNTTGSGLTLDRARQLQQAGLFALGVSLDSADPQEHDRMRGHQGAFEMAVQALDMAWEVGLYPYIIALATRDLLQPERFEAFMAFVSTTRALEVHLLEPCVTGRLAGKEDVRLSDQERQQILDYQQQYAQDDTKPIVSAFAHLESAQAFGCGAGLTHLYVDGSGEVCPCNLLPLSFGNVRDMSLESILTEMGVFFKRPRTACIGQTLNQYIDPAQVPAGPEQSKRICRNHLEKEHAIPGFTRMQERLNQRVGAEELRDAYDHVHDVYDQHWLSHATAPIHDLLDHLGLTGQERIAEVGCGTGYATVLLAQTTRTVTAMDLSEGMLKQAKQRAWKAGAQGIDFICGDALSHLEGERPFDLIFSSWVLGYIELEPFFRVAERALAGQGLLAFVVHKLDSPQRETEIFHELVAKDPACLQKQVAFDFPRDRDHVEGLLAQTGLTVEHLWEGTVSFPCQTPEQALEHLLKSGAGTAFYEAVVPHRREVLKQTFLEQLTQRTQGETGVRVDHDYIACIARKRGTHHE